MALTVIQAFNEFLKDKVNLLPTNTSNARTSRDWLVQQILKFPLNNDAFPEIYNEKNIFFGSFDRRTKKRPLDDIDIMIAIKALGSTYLEQSYDAIEIHVPTTATRLYKLCNDNSNILNSRKVLNLLKQNLKNITQYEKADIHSNQEATTLKLTSYEWNFDIVPCFFTVPDQSMNTYYIIPNGNGGWQKTDPRKDRAKVSDINQSHNGNILNIIRTVKYWNRRQTMPSMNSYLLENLILNYYENRTVTAMSYVDMEMVSVLEYIGNSIFHDVQDPKGIQGNINTLEFVEKFKISQRAKSDLEKAKEAREYERKEEQKNSIDKWGEIFGNDFPKYG